MFCPECGAEYRQGFDRCVDCDADLVYELSAPPEEGHEAPEYVELIETTRPDEIPVIKSLLEGAGIPFNVEGEDLMNLFPGMLGRIYKPGGGVTFLVPVDRAEEAQKRLDAHPEDFEGRVEKAVE